MDSGIVYGCVTPHPPILIPSVAGGRAGRVAQTRRAMETVAREAANLAPDVVLVVSPHAPINPYAMGVCVAPGYTGGFEEFGSASEALAIGGDPVLAAELLAECKRAGVPAGSIGRAGSDYRLDHGAAVPLHFLTTAGLRCPAVLLSFSALSMEDHRRFGKAVASAVKAHGSRAVLVASGDLSHRLLPGAPAGYSPMGKQFDDALVAAVQSGRLSAILAIDEEVRVQAGECGYRSFVIAHGAMPDARAEVLTYEGPFGVGYLVARLVPPAPAGGQADPRDTAREPVLSADETAALALAREAVEGFVRRGETICPSSPARGLLARRAGVFVSLKKAGQLRGCIGTFQPTEANVAQEIVRNAIASASRDPRFDPVSEDELGMLSYSIDILSRPEPVQDERQLDPEKYGVIVRAGERRGLLLPALSGVTTVDAQLDIARRKAGIRPGEPVEIMRFTVHRISE